MLDEWSANDTLSRRTLLTALEITVVRLNDWTRTFGSEFKMFGRIPKNIKLVATLCIEDNNGDKVDDDLEEDEKIEPPFLDKRISAGYEQKKDHKAQSTSKRREKPPG